VWFLANNTPYGAERNWVRDKNGAHGWVVAVRATFVIDARGVPVLAEEQPPPVLAPEHYEGPGDSSLRYDSDLLGLKPTTDVIANGSAHAPGARPTTSVPVVMRVGPIEKQLVVHGDRVYYDGAVGLATTSARPFVSRPIRYEFAFGGSGTADPDPSKHRIDERNPVGRGFGPNKADWVNKAAHAVEYPSGDPTRRGPAGFGAIDRGWTPRRSFAGTYDAQWVETKKPLLPSDYDPAYCQCAPLDQRPASPLVGGEKVGLLNMTPQGSLVFELPKVTLGLSSWFGRTERAHDPPVLTTVLLEPEERRVSMVWQSVLQVAAREADFLDQTKIEARPS